MIGGYFMKKVFLLRLELIMHVVDRFETKKEEYLVFEDKKVCENWLIKSGFVYGQDLMYVYKIDNNYWLHQNNIDMIKAFAYIDEVEISDINEDKPNWVVKMMIENYKGLRESLKGKDRGEYNNKFLNK